jgi:folylpolyglutamate synthase/dihydropteroate synthase
MMDKPALPMLKKLSPWVKQAYFPWFYRERQKPPAELEREVAGLWKNRPLNAVVDLGALLLKLWRTRQPFLVAGSLYLAGEALKILEKEGKCAKR